MIRATQISRVALLAVALLLGCSPMIDPSQVPENDCPDAPNQTNLIEEALMLPGRDCMSCHRPGGLAGGEVWTAAGTVYGNGYGPCDTGGIEGVEVDITDMNNEVLLTLFTNSAGNFFTSEGILSNVSQANPIRARITLGNQVAYMTDFQSSADCPSCHNPSGPAGARIYLP